MYIASNIISCRRIAATNEDVFVMFSHQIECPHGIELQVIFRWREALYDSNAIVFKIFHDWVGF